MDEGSTDRTAEIARTYRCTVLQKTKNGGPGAARNFGAGQSKSPLLLFIDSDCSVPSDWIQQYVSLFEEHQDTACICSGYSDNLTQTFWAQYQWYDTVFNQLSAPKHPRWASSCNF